MSQPTTEPPRRRLVLMTTGGTIEKVYDERTGELSNRHTIVDRMLQELRLVDRSVEVVELMSKDSLDMDDADRTRILEAVRRALTAERDEPLAGIVILHGTDTLENTGALLERRLADDLGRQGAVVALTGALRPFEMKRSDALQNLTEAMFATSVLAPGVYCVAHGRALRFPGVRKDRNRGTFVPTEPADAAAIE